MTSRPRCESTTGGPNPQSRSSGELTHDSHAARSPLERTDRSVEAARLGGEEHEAISKADLQAAHKQRLSAQENPKVLPGDQAASGWPNSATSLAPAEVKRSSPTARRVVGSSVVG